MEVEAAALLARCNAHAAQTLLSLVAAIIHYRRFCGYRQSRPQVRTRAAVCQPVSQPPVPISARLPSPDFAAWSFAVQRCWSWEPQGREDFGSSILARMDGMWIKPAAAAAAAAAWAGRLHHLINVKAPDALVALMPSSHRAGQSGGGTSAVVAARGARYNVGAAAAAGRLHRTHPRCSREARPHASLRPPAQPHAPVRFVAPIDSVHLTAFYDFTTTIFRSTIFSEFVRDEFGDPTCSQLNAHLLCMTPSAQSCACT